MQCTTAAHTGCHTEGRVLHCLRRHQLGWTNSMLAVSPVWSLPVGGLHVQCGSHVTITLTKS